MFRKLYSIIKVWVCKEYQIALPRLQYQMKYCPDRKRSNIFQAPAECEQHGKEEDSGNAYLEDFLIAITDNTAAEN